AAPPPPPLLPGPRASDAAPAGGPGLAGPPAPPEGPPPAPPVGAPAPPAGPPAAPPVPPADAPAPPAGPPPAPPAGPPVAPERRPGPVEPLRLEKGAATVPPPRHDPRVTGATAYAEGDVAVPPAPPEARAEPSPEPLPEPDERPAVGHLGDRAPTYAAEPGALPAADPAELDLLTPDTVLEGARYGTYTLRAASLRGDSARYRGDARRDFLLTARFGSGDDALVLVVLAGGDRAAPGAREAAAELGHSVAAAVGRSRERLAEDIRAGRREALLSGLQRLTDRGYGRLRARAAELGLDEESYTAGLRGLLLPLDPRCPHRVCFGFGAGGVFRLRGGRWQDLEEDAAAGAFRFRAAAARPGDTLLLCSGGLADPMREEGLLPAELAARWSQGEPPGLAAFLADTQLRLKGYADDRTAAAVWEA
ncbi:protein phosphatase 2C domain-containing protein, partial [Streptomyces sp. NPDC089915]|uniref:protein phosphatase 2C domain-containing protein n=1 Tax=Streptomyces sp. NPDC089915 TaxID=3155186 RepID=UPI00343F8DA3